MNNISFKFCVTRVLFLFVVLTHCGRVTDICVSDLGHISLDYGLLPDWRQAII